MVKRLGILGRMPARRLIVPLCCGINSGPDLAKKLSQLVKMEKNLMRSMELVGRERREVAVCISSKGLLDDIREAI